MNAAENEHPGSSLRCTDVLKVAGRTEFKQKGKNKAYECFGAAHGEKDTDWSFLLDEQHNRWHCFVCDNRDGSAWDLVAVIRGLTKYEDDPEGNEEWVKTKIGNERFAGNSSPKKFEKLVPGEVAFSIQPSLVAAFGWTGAAFVSQLHYWLSKCGMSKYGHFYQGRWWIYNSYAQWQEQFFFIGKGQLRNTVKELEGQGVVLSRMKGRQKYYSLEYKILFKLTRADHHTETKEEPDITNTFLTQILPVSENEGARKVAPLVVENYHHQEAQPVTKVSPLENRAVAAVPSNLDESRVLVLKKKYDQDMAMQGRDTGRKVSVLSDHDAEMIVAFQNTFAGQLGTFRLARRRGR